MKIISILVASAAAAAIGFADAKFTRGSLYKTKEHADRHLSTELSMPMKMKDSPGDNAGIAELLTDDGVSKEVISGFLTALEISGAKMSSGPARDLCATILDEILDFFLFGREVEEAIKVIVCGPITSLKPSQAPSDVPSAKPSDVPSAIASLKPSQAPSDMPSTGSCLGDDDCGIGEFCGASPYGTKKCQDCLCGVSGVFSYLGDTCDSDADCKGVAGSTCRNTDTGNYCPNRLP